MNVGASLYATPVSYTHLDVYKRQAFSKEFDALEAQVKDYYAPTLSKLKNMDPDNVMMYLFQTYKLPWLKGRFFEGAPIPTPLAGMDQQEADMAYDQLTALLFSSRPAVIRDPYALGEEGLARFDNMGALAAQTAQETCDAARAKLDAQQAEAASQWKKYFQQQIKDINASGSGTCLGFMTLEQDDDDPIAE